ncbi:MAG: thermosome subunit alpha [Nanoarchaeota archaeon]
MADNYQGSQGQPIYILPEGSQRSSGKSAQRMNIEAAKLVGETVRTTLGPKGMDKMLVDSSNEVTITNDGVTILKEIAIEHPSAKMIVEIAKTQEDEVGDGTTTAVVVAGELLKKAQELLDMEIHPTVIAKGYRLGAEKSKAILNSIAKQLSYNDKATLKQIASTAMTGKGAEFAKEKLSGIAVDAILKIIEKEGDKVKEADIESIKLEKKVGASDAESELISGVVIDKERTHTGMPKEIENAKVALINSPIEIKNTEIDSKIQITDPSQLQGFLDQEEDMLKKMVDQITSSGAKAVFCQKGIDEVAQHFLAKEGILAIRRVKKSDMEAISRATGARIVTQIHELSSQDLGYSGKIEQLKVGDEEMTYIRECKNPKTVTILVRGSTEHIADEIKRAVEDAIGDLRSALKSGWVVAGAGACETELSMQLRKYSESLSGREQLAVKAFADSCEIIPRTLAENAGLDPIDAMAELNSAHDKGKCLAGINVFTGKVMDAWKKGVIEPLQIKTQAFDSASQVAEMILRIDDVISTTPAKQDNCNHDIPNY